MSFLQLFFVVRARGGDDDFFRRDDQCSLGRGRPVEHRLDRRLEGVNDLPLGDVLRRSFDLIPSQVLDVVDGDRNFSVVCGQVL